MKFLQLICHFVLTQSGAKVKQIPTRACASVRPPLGFAWPARLGVYTEVKRLRIGGPGMKNPARGTDCG